MAITLPLYQVDAFAEKVFQGNPAAVCPLAAWLDDKLMQKIAAENNLSETAFFVKQGDRYRLRWFTPEKEIDLCGHATLAAAHVIFNYLSPELNVVAFTSQSGMLMVEKYGGKRLRMTFPARPGMRCEPPTQMEQALNTKVAEVYKARDYMVVLDSQQQVQNVHPDFQLLHTLDAEGIIVTAKGDSVDFVSRFFAPRCGVPEDPVTGSAHCTLIPYWAERLRKRHLTACQLSARTGMLYCTDCGDMVLIEGKAVTFLRGEIYLDELEDA